MLDVQSYDLSELIDKECPPANFVELIQLLIDEVAKLRLGTTVTTGGASGCPECDMVTASCFQQQYGTVISMTEYVTAIGTTLCDQQVLIQTQNNALAQMQQQIAALQAQVNLLIGG